MAITTPMPIARPVLMLRAGLDAEDVEEGEDAGEEDGPGPVRHTGSEDVGLLADPDDADHRVEHVVHHHAPAGDVAERGIDLLADVGEGGAGARVGARHAAVADGGEQHRHHGDEDGGDDVAPCRDC